MTEVIKEVNEENETESKSKPIQTHSKWIALTTTKNKSKNHKGKLFKAVIQANFKDTTNSYLELD